jgi:hypothetical protein
MTFRWRAHDGRGIARQITYVPQEAAYRNAALAYIFIYVANLKLRRSSPQTTLGLDFEQQ